MIAVSGAVAAALATAGAVAAPPCSEPKGGGYLHQRLAKLASVKQGLPGRNWVNLFTYEWLSDLGIYRLTGMVSYWPALPAGLVASSDAYGVAVETTPGGLVGLDSLGCVPGGPAPHSDKRRLSLAPVNRQWEVRSPPGFGRLRMRTKEVMQFG